jgi:leucyl aminopeptidase
MVAAAAAVDGLVAVGVPVGSGPDGPQLAAGLPTAACGFALPASLDPSWCTRQGFSAKVGQVLVLRAGDGPARMLVGLGPVGSSNPERWRRAAAAFVRSAGEGGCAAFVLPAVEPAVSLPEIGSAVSEGAALAAYRYTRFKTTPGDGVIERLVVTVDDVPADVNQAIGDGVARGARIAGAVSVARDLVNCPPSHLTPTIMADQALELLRGRPAIRVQVWDGARIADEGLGGIIGVSRGSAEPPKLLRIDYEPVRPLEVGGRVPHVALVGKGVTFDSGGLSLKTPEGMVNQKTDMSGAAAVLATMSACPDAGVQVRVTGFVPMVENMPGGNAMKPGDVVTTRNGKTIEVLNTDAEGRLILADALALATEANVDAVIDLATLTGAATAALGSLVAALFSNNYELMGKVRRAAGRAGEQVWPMPMPEDYADHINSDIADMKNTGKPGQAGAISAAMLLANFVASKPWAHLDIAGPARSTEASGYLSKGGTGFGVRTLVEFLSSYES